MAQPDHKAQILDRLSFESFYQGELQQLKPTSGGNFQALCPFHEDKNPSLSVNLKTGLFKCFACDEQGDVFQFYQRRHGCDFKEALAALGRLAGVDLTPQPRGQYKSLSLKEFALAKKLPLDFLEMQGVGEYQYPPEVFDGCRTVDFPYKDKDGKALSQRRRFGAGKEKFKWRKGDKTRLYGLWKLPKIRSAGWCLLVEGESDALTCWLHGLPALGLPGKKTWKSSRRNLLPAELKALQEVQVYLWEEPDAGVRNPKNPLERLLRDEVREDLPKVLVIPAPAGIKDLSEAHIQGREIKSLVAGLKKQARPPEPPPLAAGGFTMSDLGNARRLVALHGRDLLYSHLSKKWFIWSGKNWAVDSSGEVERRAKSTVGEIYREAAEATDLKVREALGKWALACEDSKRIIAMMRLAQSEPGMPVAPAQFDADSWLLNCQNGTVDLRTGELKPHDPADLLTCLAPVDYEPDRPCPEWEKFLYQVMLVEERPEVADDMVNFLLRALGYSLTGSCQEQCLFMLWGAGANGKSTLLELIAKVLGTYSRNTPVETLLARNKGGEIPTDVARLDGPRFVTAKEVDRGRRLSESLVKELVGQDTITARFLYGEYFDFKPQFKLWIATNNKPRISGSDNSIWRRIMFLPFLLNVPKEEQDAELPEKLWAEAPGILAWLVRGCLLWQEMGLDPPQEVLEATAEYRAEMDVLAEFLEAKCLKGGTLAVSAADLYKAYQDWAEEQGLTEKERLKKRSFGLALGEHGFQSFKSGGGVRSWRGLGLRTI
ncbi:MAG: phage/plasmid primase, P4 family [Deltaproteobacteria bacterium]|nr:phage/plasmid primase, P4 family [Deltaproteobacteria bacterium]